MMSVGYNGLWGLLILAGDIWAVINIAQSSASNEKKLIWILVVVLLPLLGLILASMVLQALPGRLQTATKPASLEARVSKVAVARHPRLR